MFRAALTAMFSLVLVAPSVWAQSAEIATPVTVSGSRMLGSPQMLAADASGTAEGQTSGVVSSFDDATAVIVLQDGQRLHVTPQTVIIVDNRPVQARSLSPGTVVMIRNAEPMTAVSPAPTGGSFAAPSITKPTDPGMVEGASGSAFPRGALDQNATSSATLGGVEAP